MTLHPVFFDLLCCWLARIRYVLELLDISVACWLIFDVYLFRGGRAVTSEGPYQTTMLRSYCPSTITGALGAYRAIIWRSYGVILPAG